MLRVFNNKRELFSLIERLGHENIESNSDVPINHEQPLFTEHGYLGKFKILPNGKLEADINTQVIMSEME